MVPEERAFFEDESQLAAAAAVDAPVRREG